MEIPAPEGKVCRQQLEERQESSGGGSEFPEVDAWNYAKRIFQTDSKVQDGTGND
jgi:hypothetical protein